MIPPFTPFAPLGSPADLVRRFGIARRQVPPWSLLACAASPLILGFYRPTRRRPTRRPTLTTEPAP